MTWTPEQRRRGRVVILGCLLLYALLTTLAVVGWTPMDRIDRAIGRHPQDLAEDHGFFGDWWIWVGRVTGPREMMILTAVVALVLLARRQVRAALLVGVAMLSTEWLTRGFKALVERQRPVWREPIEILNSYSFPSGHSSGIAAAAALTLLLTTFWMDAGRLRTGLQGAAVALALLVGADRIFLGVHNLSDVIAGYALGVAVVLTTLLAVQRWVPVRA